MFLKVFDFESYHSRPEAYKRLLEEYQMEIMDEPLRIFLKKKPLNNLKGNKLKEVALVDDKYFIFLDSTEFRNVHAFDLDGNWLWDIEPCNYKDGKPAKYFYGICDAITDESGKRQLIVGNFPVTYRTDLATGKGTTIWKIEDDTDSR